MDPCSSLACFLSVRDPRQGADAVWAVWAVWALWAVGCGLWAVGCVGCVGCMRTGASRLLLSICITCIPCRSVDTLCEWCRSVGSSDPGGGDSTPGAGVWGSPGQESTNTSPGMTLSGSTRRLMEVRRCSPCAENPVMNALGARQSLVLIPVMNSGVLAKALC